MRINTNLKYALRDISLIPATISEVKSRSECNPYNKDGKLPLFTAPMSTVVSLENYKLFHQQGVTPIIPRNIHIDNRIDLLIEGEWVAFGISEIEDILLSADFNGYNNSEFKILIDVANGHMSRLLDLSRKLKEKYPYCVLMLGNIANPETYLEYCKASIDFCRVGIGGGCFGGDSLVLTTNGYRKIRDIKKGDFVLTHRNRFRKVLQTHKKKNEKELIIINNNTTTKDHLYLVVNKIDVLKMNDNNYNEFSYWVEANELDCEKHFLIKGKSTQT